MTDPLDLKAFFERKSKLSKRRKRLARPLLLKALTLIEHISCEGLHCNAKFMEECLSDIYTIAHGLSTCHDGCPVKKEGLAKIKKFKENDQC